LRRCNRCCARRVMPCSRPRTPGTAFPPVPPWRCRCSRNMPRNSASIWTRWRNRIWHSSAPPWRTRRAHCGAIRSAIRKRWRWNSPPRCYWWTRPWSTTASPTATCRSRPASCWRAWTRWRRPSLRRNWKRRTWARCRAPPRSACSSARWHARSRPTWRTWSASWTASYRDKASALEWKELAGPSSRSRGAHHPRPRRCGQPVARFAARRIQAFLAPDSAREQALFEEVAHKLSGLGFFVDAVQQRPRRSAGHPQSPSVPHDEDEDLRGETVETQILQVARDTQMLAEAIRDKPADDALRAELKANLTTLRDDAKLLANAGVEMRAVEALAALEQSGEDAAAQIGAALAEVPVAPEIAPPSDDTVRRPAPAPRCWTRNSWRFSWRRPTRCSAPSPRTCPGHRVCPTTRKC